MAQSPHTNPRFRKPQGKVQFRADKKLALILDKIALDAIPNGDGEPPTKAEVARALVEQAAKALTGRVAWMTAKPPTEKQKELLTKAGYEPVITGVSEDAMYPDFDKVEEFFATVYVTNPWHVIQAVTRGLTILLWEKDALVCYHGHGLVRRYQL